MQVIESHYGKDENSEYVREMGFLIQQLDAKTVEYARARAAYVCGRLHT